MSKPFFLPIFILVSLVATAQQTYDETGNQAKFNNALELYNNKAYAAAQKGFNEVALANNEAVNLKADASYYNAICAVKLNQTDADKKIMQFVEDYPNSNKKNKAFLNVGNYYFANKRPAYALKWYQKVNPEALSKENKKELNFKTGYSLLVSKDLQNAKDKFLPLINDAKYGNDARYYYGYIAYKLEDYGLAESTLKEIADNESYKAEISYYLLDISFKAGKFERCVEVGKELLKTANKKDASEISKIVGESYFNLEKYDEAIPYLKAYRGKRNKWTNTDYYLLGYAYYKQNDFENAVNYFNKIIDEKNAVAQNAYYHLAECYLNIEKKNEALNAFKAASEMTFNTKIKEDAALNYAKLSYEEGNPFENVADVLQNYLETYPNSTSYKEINELLVSAFINEQNYQGALDYLQKKNTPENKILAIEVSLYRGMQLFSNEEYQQSIPFFNTAKENTDVEFRNKARYWEAEAQYRLENYKDALQKFINLNNQLRTNNKTDFQTLGYNIGYTHFKLQEYEKAATTFRVFIKKYNGDEDIIDDTYIRLGDSYFAIRSYVKAISAYKYIVDNNRAGADYAQYQIGMSYGFTNDNDAKITALTKVINNYSVSNLKDDALYQLATTYTKIKNNEKAHQAYDRLLSKHPKSVFLARALVRQGLLYYNDNNNKLALEKFKLTAQKFPNSPDAKEAVRNAKNIYVDEDRLDEYVAWTNTLQFINVSDTELENSSFAIAERKYFAGKNSGALMSLKKYLNDFPNGKSALKANYYLADVLYKEQLFDRAIDQYKKVLESGQSEYSEDALVKLSLIYLKQEEFENAMPYLEQLEQEAYASENVLFSQSNLMKGYYEMDNFEKAFSYAQKVLEKDKLEEKVKLDAQIIIARTAFKTDKIDTAEEYFNEVGKTASGELKAETLYYDALFKNRDKDYTGSNTVIQKLIADYSAYKYWGVKSYIIMAKNYYQLKDAYQATFILENIIKNFSQFEDVVEEAKTELKSIKENESKTNNSVTPQNKN